jgi:hypothetical protein
MDTLKYKIGFLVACFFIGFIIYINSSNSKEDIDPKELTMSNIDKLELTRISDGKKVYLFDSIRINPIINQFLNSTKTEIYNPKISSTKYYCRIHFTNKESELIGFDEHPIDGRCFFYRISKYKNDSLFYFLDEIDF